MKASVNPQWEPRVGRECRYCQHYGGQLRKGKHPDATGYVAGDTPDNRSVWCMKAEIVQGQPEYGCASFERAPGTDDDLQVAGEQG